MYVFVTDTINIADEIVVPNDVIIKSALDFAIDQPGWIEDLRV